MEQADEERTTRTHEQAAQLQPAEQKKQRRRQGQCQLQAVYKLDFIKFVLSIVVIYAERQRFVFKRQHDKILYK